MRKVKGNSFTIDKKFTKTIVNKIMEDNPELDEFDDKDKIIKMTRFVLQYITSNLDKKSGNTKIKVDMLIRGKIPPIEKMFIGEGYVFDWKSVGF